MVGKEEYPDSFTSFTGKLSGNEIIFHFSGQATVYFGEEILQTYPDSIRFLPKGNFSKYAVERHERGECILVNFSADRPVSDKAFVMMPENAEKIGTLFKKIFISWVSKKDGYYFECISLLYKIFSLLQQRNYVPDSHFLKIKPAIEYIHNNFLKEKISTTHLAALCGISESYLKRLFKEKYDTPPKKYIIQLKINHACELLRMGEYTITQAAELCNFSDVYFFSRQFREYLGITPTQFVRKYKSSK